MPETTASSCLYSLKYSLNSPYFSKLSQQTLIKERRGWINHLVPQLANKISYEGVNQGIGVNKENVCSTYLVFIMNQFYEQKQLKISRL